MASERRALDRDSIVRTDFKSAVRGYDRWEVQQHLKELNIEISVLIEALSRGEGDLPAPIRDRIQSRVALAEIDAFEIRRNAERVAKSEREAADEMVLETLQRASDHAAELVAKAEASSSAVLETARGEVDQIRDLARKEGFAAGYAEVETSRQEWAEEQRALLAAAAEERDRADREAERERRDRLAAQDDEVAQHRAELEHEVALVFEAAREAERTAGRALETARLEADELRAESRLEASAEAEEIRAAAIEDAKDTAEAARIASEAAAAADDRRSAAVAARAWDDLAAEVLSGGDPRSRA